MEKTKKITFVITKPIQLLTVLAILSKKINNDEINVIFCNTFNDAYNIETRFRIAVNEKIITYRSENRIQAIKLAAKNNTNKLYIDSDVGLQHFIALLRFKILRSPSTINVFEEGYGTYYLESYNRFTKYIAKCLGIASGFGVCKFTKNIYVFNVEEFQKKFQKTCKKVVLIETKIWEILDIERDIINYTFNIKKFKIEEDRLECKIYMTSHDINYKFLDGFKLEKNDLYIKFHPHIKNPPKLDGIKTLSTSTPVEVILKELLKNYKKITIYDHNSAARRYVMDPRIDFQSIENLKV